MELTKEKQIDGVAQRDFRLEVDGQSVPCTVWSHPDAGPAPVLICMGHGGSQHKKTAGIRARALEYAARLGWVTLAIDAPGHGDRISRERSAELERSVGARVTGRADGRGLDPEEARALSSIAQRAVPEWRAAIDSTLGLDCVSPHAAVGYWGVSMGTRIGVPMVAGDPRIRCAIFGLAGVRPGQADFAEAARRIEIPIQFVFQWDDAVAPREHGIELFDAFGSKEKTMHVNPGGHMGIPSFERDAWLAFFQRHLS